MFPEAYENENECFGQNSFGMLEKSQRLIFPIEGHQHSTCLESSFDEVFLTDFAPNCSAISVCTQEDRSYETFSIADDFFGESVDHFLDDFIPKGLQQEAMAESPIPKIQNEEKILQESLEDNQVQIENENENNREDADHNSHDETKNIPKNYIKAIFNFILQNEEFIEKLLSKLTSQEGRQVSRLSDFVQEEKKVKKYTIERMKQLWTHPQNGKAMRIISCEFLRKRSLGYIFGSKIERKMSHIKHRYKFIQAIEDPSKFTNIK